MKKIYLIFFFALVSQILLAQEKSSYHHCSGAKVKNANLQFKKSNVGKNIDIQYQRLFFEINPSALYVKGNTQVYFKTLESLHAFTLDFFHSLNADSILYHHQKITSTHSGNELKIELGITLAAQTLDSVQIFFQGIPQGEGSTDGFNQHYHGISPAIFTLSEPYGAREWFPCKQDLDDKIDSIDIFVKTQKAYRAAANGLLISEIEQDGYKTYHWKHRHPIAAYLIAIAVTNYKFYSDYAHLSENDSVEILNYLYPENFENLKPQIAITKDLVEHFSQLFIKYPFSDEKYGHAQFGWGGGMEHQTMSFMGAWNFSIIAHELAHQWFGDFITCGSWKDIWLNEGFATYLESLAYEHFYGYSSYQSDVANNFTMALRSPNGSVYVDDTTNIGRIFSGNLSYAKGGSVLHMLRKQIGDEAFFSGVKNYLADPDLAHGYAKTHHLQAHLEAASGKELDDFFTDWIFGKGFPNYTLYWSQDQQNIMNFQILQTQSDASVDFFQMTVPVRIANGNVDTTIYLKHDYSGQTFYVPIDFRAAVVQLDPENHILKGNSIVGFISFLNSDKNLLLAPNPVKDFCRVYLQNDFYFSDIEIFTIKGERVKKLQAGYYSNFIEFDLSDLAKGNYLLKLKTENEIFTNLIIKQ